MIKLKQQLFLLPSFLFIFLGLLLIANQNQVIAMYSDNSETIDQNLSEKHLSIDEQILKIKNLIDINKQQIIFIEQKIKKLPDENIQGNILYKLNQNLLQLMEFTINHNKALQIIIIEQEIKKLSDEKVKKNILFELNQNLLQLIELTTNHNKALVMNSNNFEKSDSNLIENNPTNEEKILKIQNTIHKIRYRMIEIEQEIQTLPDGNDKKNILCELYENLIQLINYNEQEMKMQTILSELGFIN
ncbi:MAG: SVM family protein [Candidatus Phytoplasma australasiaticum]|nr:SVM family protein [Candidatus Phytoplasma australasiaticum]